MKRTNLLSAVLICVLLSLTLFALTASATGNVAKIGEVEYATLAEAVAAANDGERVTLLCDTEIDDTVTIGGAITLDLGGKTITATNPGYARYRKLYVTASATIENGTLSNCYVDATANLTMTGVDISIVDNPTYKVTTYALYLQGANCKQVTLNNCNISLTTPRGSACKPLFIDWTAAGSTITVNGGSLTLVKNDGSGYGMGVVNTVADNITMTLNGVDVVYKQNSDSYHALNFGSNGGMLTVNGGSITATNIDGTESRDALYAYTNKSIVVNVEGDAVVNGKIGFGKKGANVPKINIKGGTFTDEALINVGSPEADPSASLVVTGGSFAASDANRAALAAAGVTFIEEGGRLVGVDVSARVAKVGETYYLDFAEAVAAANETAEKEIVIVGAVETDVATISGLVIKTEGASAKLAVSVAAGTLKEQIASVFNAATFESASLVEVVSGAEVVASFGDVVVRGGAIVSGVVSDNAMAKVGYYYHPTLLNIASGSAYMDSGTAGGTMGKHNIVKYGAGTEYIVGVELSNGGVDYLRVYKKPADAIVFATNNDSATAQVNDTVVLFDNVTDIENYYAGGGTYYVSNVGTGVHYATFTLDLGGHTWSSAYQSDSELVYMLAITANNTDITIKNGTITGTNATYGITTNGMFDNTNLTLSDLTINVPNGSGMYLPAGGIVTMTNVTINAKSVGVQTCAADITLNGCNITTDGDDRAAEKAGGDGLIADGAAVSIVNRPGYARVPSVTINGGTFTSGAATAPVKAYDWNFTGTAGAQNNTEWTPETQPAAITGTDATVSTVGASEGEWVEFVPAAAVVDGDKYATLAEAIEAAKNGKTVKLLSDVEINKVEANSGVNAIQIPAGSDITLDLNGYTITKVGPAGDWSEVQTSAIINRGTLTITDLSDTQTGKIVGGGYEWCNGAVVKNYGTLNIDGGRFESGAGTNGMGLSGHYVIFNLGTANITDGKFFSNSTSTALIRNDVTMDITGGEFEQKDFLVLRNADTTAVMTFGGVAVVKHSNDRSVQNYGTLTIEGGELNGKVQTVSYNDHAAITYITEGTVNGDVEIAKSKAKDYTGEIPASTVEISGGEFDRAVPAEFCAEGFTPKAGENGIFGVVAETSRFGRNLVLVNMPTVTYNGGVYYPVEIYCGIDSLDYSEVGVEYTVVFTGAYAGEHTGIKKTNTVYTKMRVMTNAGVEKVYTPEDLESSYMYGQQFLFDTTKYASEDVTIIIKPYAKSLDGSTTYYGSEVTLSEAVLAAMNTHLFKAVR